MVNKASVIDNKLFWKKYTHLIPFLSPCLDGFLDCLPLALDWDLDWDLGPPLVGETEDSLDLVHLGVYTILDHMSSIYPKQNLISITELSLRSMTAWAASFQEYFRPLTASLSYSMVTTARGSAIFTSLVTSIIRCQLIMSSPAEPPELGPAVLGPPGHILTELEPGASQYPRLAPRLLPLLVFSGNLLIESDCVYETYCKPEGDHDGHAVTHLWANCDA